MSARTPKAVFSLDPKSPTTSWSDSRLVRACLDGNEQAWAALIEKYKNLIYSIPLRYHAPTQDAADIFQAVCLELFSELGKLRKIESLRSWLITVATHKSYQWKKKQERWSGQEPKEVEENMAGAAGATAAVPAEHQVIADAEREQIVREAVERLSDRCREMIRLLFYEQPPLPYDKVAQQLGLATGSIGFIRGRCLKRLQKILVEMRFS